MDTRRQALLLTPSVANALRSSQKARPNAAFRQEITVRYGSLQDAYLIIAACMLSISSAENIAPITTRRMIHAATKKKLDKVIAFANT